MFKRYTVIFWDGTEIEVESTDIYIAGHEALVTLARQGIYKEYVEIKDIVEIK